jgi:hypothetical protein
MGIIGSNYCKPNYYLLAIHGVTMGKEHFPKYFWRIKMAVKFVVVMKGNISKLLPHYIN